MPREDTPNAFSAATPSPCPCAVEGRGTADCWHRAYADGQADLLSEFMTAIDSYFDGHEPGHDCRVCRVMRAMVETCPQLSEIPRLLEEGLRLMILDPEARANLKLSIAAADHADREGR